MPLRSWCAALLVTLTPIQALAQLTSLPTNALALRASADGAFAAGRFAEALPLYVQFATLNPSNGHAFTRQADCCLSLGRPRDAVVPLTRAMELGALQAPDALYQIARCHALAGQGDAAIDALSRSLAAGYRFRPRIVADKAFASLADDPRFLPLTGRLPTDVALSRTDGFRHDLDFLTDEVRRVHYLYRRQPLPDAYVTLAASLREKIPAVSDEEVAVEFQHLLATLGDGHSLLLPFGMKRGQLPRLPLTFYLFSDGLFITGAPADHRDLVGARVVRLAGMTPDDLLKNLEPYLSRDNPMGTRWTGPVYLTFPHFLRAAGAKIVDPTHVPLAVAAVDGGSREVTLSAVSPVDPDDIAIKLPPPKGPATRPTSFRPDTNYFLHEIDDRTLYVQFNQVQDAKDESLAAFASRLRKHVDTHSTQTLILDLRNNNGGEGSLLPDLEHVLIHFDASRPDARLYVLIGRTTFSAAQQLASFLSVHTRAVFVGEPTGSRPNRPGDEAPVVLPYSGLRVAIASGYHQAAPKDDRIWIPPDLPVSLTSGDYFQGRDPALMAVLAVRP